MEIRESLACKIPMWVTQSNLFNYILFEHCAIKDPAWKGPNCIAIWHIRYKKEFHAPKVAALTRAYFFKKWCEKQKRFEETTQKLAADGIEFIGDLSQNWDFNTYYKVQIGEIKLYA